MSLRVEDMQSDIHRCSILDRAINRVKMDSAYNISVYIDTRCLLPTLIFCDRLFSIAGYAFSNRRRRKLSEKLQSHLFLFMSTGYWGIADVQEIVHQ